MRTRVLTCPNCGGDSVRRSKRQSSLEFLRMAFGVYPFRCLHCGVRFWVSVWLFSKLGFAKCPKCLSLELTVWPQKYFHPTLWRNLLLTFGAHRYRCGPCRHNFLSFRPRHSGHVLDSGPEQVVTQDPNRAA